MRSISSSTVSGDFSSLDGFPVSFDVFFSLDGFPVSSSVFLVFSGEASGLGGGNFSGSLRFTRGCNMVATLSDRLVFGVSFLSDVVDFTGEGLGEVLGVLVREDIER